MVQSQQEMVITSREGENSKARTKRDSWNTRDHPFHICKGGLINERKGESKKCQKETGCTVPVQVIINEHRQVIQPLSSSINTGKDPTSAK
ncbi:hypothetical protein M419DRAFT_124612 [Trichoderma reesei RUT C-30]|uniref:Uncharacterized protein n=1 Tax=Hypocrea jecorina (strain ATCC 56765 / BCRC 32924 / NRRL 11460 / Rut C-30) TaxID=1344414 RepID=A0A024S0X5_HYPJR|nr:hypothetical protein M419DRAFT_124612 [Trichoderma reesei RUT C-30]